jgi:2-hydroxy-3-keto-5-methylthiopentenyl-1-phosphate phosphatase
LKDALSYIVFSDFDGTVSATDIGDALFSYFGDGQKCSDVYEEFLKGGINACECWSEICRTVPMLTKHEADAFVDGQTVTEGFHNFVQYCDGGSIPVYIVSDGFDVYVDRFLQRHHLDNLPRFTNSLVFENDGTLTPKFPFTDSECDRCANCKRNHVLTLSGPNHIIVYIGNGYSDRCPARYADIVFAKDELISFCENENITYHRFESFIDLLEKFRHIVERTKPKKKRTAELARNEVFSQG